MKLKKCMLLFAVVLSVCLIVGCSPKEAEQKLDSLENKMEQKLEKAEDKIEGVVTPNKDNPKVNTPAISVDEAQKTALDHAGYTAEQVTGLHTDYEVDDGIPRYEVKFYYERMEYEYEIHAETGKIISFDMDD